MFRIIPYCVIIAWLGAAPVSSQATHAWVLDTEYNEIHVVVSAQASPSEHRAAEVFQEYWSQCTGFRPPIAPEPIVGMVNVWLGRADNPFAAELRLEGLGDDGLCIRTFDRSQRRRVRDHFGLHTSFHREDRRDLVIVGGELRGTLYGVYEFFEKFMGVRWLTPEVTHVPAPPDSLPAINYRYVPPLAYREVFYRAFIHNPAYAVAHKQNGNSMSGIPPEWGGFIGFAGGFGHTFYTLVNPDRYWDEHPEYFSEVNGERQRKSQLCLTNPDVLRIATESVRELLRSNPSNRRIVSVTQMDWPFWCECANCRAVEDAEGSHSGPLIHFVNAIAEAIEPEFPDAFVDTFAYTYTRKPPKHVKPRHNVIVRLCSIECDFSKPLSDASSPQNREFQKDVKAWSKIAPNLFIWDYTQNWWSHQGPHPNFHVLQPNVKFFVGHGVMGLFEQASPTSPHSDYEYLKGYILGHAVWNPEVDWRALYDEFIELYYREAAPYIRAYHELITDKVLSDRYYLGIFTHMEWMDAPTIAQAEAIFQQAFAAAQSDEVRERLKYAYLPVQHAALTAPPEIEQQDDKLILQRPPSQTFDEYWAMIHDYGVTNIGDEGIDEFRKRLDGKTPPRHEEVALVKLSNDRYEVWTLPAWQGSIVRFRDKETGAEAFQRFEQWISDEGTLQEWQVMDPTAPVVEEPFVDGYDVIEQRANRLVLRAVADNLELTRTMELPEGDAPLCIDLAIKNVGTTPVAPRVKLHPEFWTHDEKRPEVWVDRAGAWEAVALTWVGAGDIAASAVPSEGVAQWAMRLPKCGITIVNAIDAAQLDRLFYFYSHEKDFMNLEVVPLLTPLAPGETRNVDVRYSMSDTLPQAIR